MDWMEMVSEFLSILMMAAITILVPVVAKFVAGWLKVKAKEIEAQLPAEMLAYTRIVARIVVAAAEQAGLVDAALNLGDAKKKWAFDMGELMLEQYLGLDLDLDALGDAFWAAILAGLDVSIEAEVANMNYGRLWGEQPGSPAGRLLEVV